MGNLSLEGYLQENNTKIQISCRLLEASSEIVGLDAWMLDYMNSWPNVLAQDSYALILHWLLKHRRSGHSGSGDTQVANLPDGG